MSKEDEICWDLSNVEESKLACAEWGKEINVAAEGHEDFIVTEPLNDIAVEELGALGNAILALHHRIADLEAKVEELSK